MSQYSKKKVFEEIDREKKKRIQKLKETGDLIRPFNTLFDIPGVKRSNAINALVYLGVDFSPALTKANSVRERYVEGGVFDTSQIFEMKSIPGDSLRDVAKSIHMFSSKAVSILRGDKHASLEYKTMHMEKSGSFLNIDYSMFRPDRVPVSRKKYYKFLRPG